MTTPNFINRKLKYEITLEEYADIACNADDDVVEHIVSFQREFCPRCEKGADMWGPFCSKMFTMKFCVFEWNSINYIELLLFVSHRSEYIHPV